MTEHTPTPWFTNRKFEVGPRPRTDDQSDGMLHPVADVFGDNAKNDAAFIVKACNAHDALVKALMLAEDVLSRSPYSSAMWPNGMHPQVGITQIRDALKATPALLPLDGKVTP